MISVTMILTISLLNAAIKESVEWFLENYETCRRGH
jgi:diacylglycerol kinase